MSLVLGELGLSLQEDKPLRPKPGTLRPPTPRIRLTVGAFIDLMTKWQVPRDSPLFVHIKGLHPEVAERAVYAIESVLGSDDHSLVCMDAEGVPQGILDAV